MEELYSIFSWICIAGIIYGVAMAIIWIFIGILGGPCVMLRPPKIPEPPKLPKLPNKGD